MKVRCMHDHVKASVQDFNPDHIILHCRTNDLSSERRASQIARSIIELALTLKSEDNKISISLTEPRNNNLNNKSALNERFLISTILIQFSQKITLMKVSYILTGMEQ